MKTKFHWLALIGSAALSMPAQAGNHHGGGSFNGAARAPARSSGASVQSMPRGNSGGGRTIYSGQRFSPVGMRSSANAFRPHYINSSGATAIGARQFTPGSVNRGNHLTRFENGGNPRGRITNSTGAGNGTIQNENDANHLARFGHNRHDRLAQLGNRAGEQNGAIRNQRNRAGQLRNGNNLPNNWRNHISGRRSAEWHHDWDRRRDHNWHGHHCRFINGSWVIFDFGFYPWWSFGYPYDYYAYGSYPYDYNYNYEPGYDDSNVYQGEPYYGANNEDSSSDQYGAQATVAAAQQRLAREGYYRGAIDGVLGAATQRALSRFQSDHGLRVTGSVTTETFRALGLQVASN